MINRLFHPFYRLMQYPVIVSKFHTFRSIYSVIVRYGIGKGKLFGFVIVQRHIKAFAAVQWFLFLLFGMPDWDVEGNLPLHSVKPPVEPQSKCYRKVNNEMSSRVTGRSRTF